LVKIGFIVEGDSEAILLKNENFITFLKSLNLLSDKEFVINAEGMSNLYHPNANFDTISRKVNGWIQILLSKGVEIIFFLIDFDNSDACFTLFKSKVFLQEGNIVIIARQTLEAWFLADQQALSNYLQQNINIQSPESFLQPFEEIKALRLKYRNKGISDKKILVKDIIRSGFNLVNAATHPACPSALYFLTKLQSLNSGT